MKNKQDNFWLYIAIVLASFTATVSILTAFKLFELGKKDLLVWKGSCLKSGGTWYTRIFDDYKEYVCRMEGGD